MPEEVADKLYSTHSDFVACVEQARYCQQIEDFLDVELMLGEIYLFENLNADFDSCSHHPRLLFVGSNHLTNLVLPEDS